MKKLSNLIQLFCKLVIKLFLLIFDTVLKIISKINSKKILFVPFYGTIAFIIYIILLIKLSGDHHFKDTLENKCINDVTQINPIQVNRIIKPTTTEEIIDVIKTTTGPISIGGGKYSMGGQTAFENSLHIDMRSFNKVLKLDTFKKQVTVQSGIKWRDLQTFIDPYDLSIKIMQTYSNFTVGGAISVNCHGRYIGHGPIISSVLELKVVKANGEIIIANRELNQEIFNAAIGGYGGIGVITEAKLQLAKNVKVERETQKVSVEDYNNFFIKNIRNNEKIVFQNGDLYPPNYDEIMSVSWKESTKPLTNEERLTPVNENYWLETQIEELVSWGYFGKWIRKNIVDHIIYLPNKVIWRNKEASYDVKELEPSSRKKQTYVLEEYFIPVENIKTFIPKMRKIFQKYQVNVINVSIRHALPDNESYLSWANKEVFAFVIYYKQKTDNASREIVKQWTLEMTEAILSEKGTWYLPYQPHATIDQFKKGYPNYTKYFELKNRLDSNHRFTNKLLDKYNPYISNKIHSERNRIDGYWRAEEQTILTIPEWYLVFNPKEYADYLENGKDPSSFPFYKSIDEYWRLYDRSLKLVSKAYPENEEYKTMLQVIGVSITMEYGVKMIYENTIGRLFSLFVEKEISNEEKIIISAQRAYSNFVYQTAWYEFKFYPWVKKVWLNTESSNCSKLRKWERTLFFTFDFTFKAMYAQLIDWAAKASYSPPVSTIYLIVSSTDSLKEDKDLKIIKKGDDKMILGITRWGAFTKVLKNISRLNITIDEISGNDEIAVSAVMHKSKNITNKNIKLLYDSRIVSNNELNRKVYLMPVRELLTFIRNAKEDNITIEHIYDY